jgi:hypothetical protein
MVHEDVSWESAGNIRHRADIDHLMALPATIAMSARRFARSLNCSNDHQPIVITLDHGKFGSPIPSMINPAPAPAGGGERINMVELDAHRHNVVSALQGWWGNRVEADPHSLHGHLQEAKRIMGNIVGVTGPAKDAKKRKPFQLPGHAKLQREINALYHLRKAAHHSEARCKEDDDENTATNIIINYWQ